MTAILGRHETKHMGHPSNPTSSVQPVSKTPKPSSVNWTGHLVHILDQSPEVLLTHLCKAFNGSPYMAHNLMHMRVVDGQIKGHVEMANHLIGNVAFKILHGGVAATLLDSIGGIVAMAEIYLRNEGERSEQMKKAGRLATVDMRIDYLAPGRGQYFVASAIVLRMGRKGCTMRMDLHNDDGQHIATGIASYAY
jgi:uncharacterized protein (TIGR00369 family)